MLPRYIYRVPLDHVRFILDYFEFFHSAPERVPISDSAETLGNPRWRCQLSVSISKKAVQPDLFHMMHNSFFFLS